MEELQYQFIESVCEGINKDLFNEIFQAKMKDPYTFAKWNWMNVNPKNLKRYVANAKYEDRKKIKINVNNSTMESKSFRIFNPLSYYLEMIIDDNVDKQEFNFFLKFSYVESIKEIQQREIVMKDIDASYVVCMCKLTDENKIKEFKELIVDPLISAPTNDLENPKYILKLAEKQKEFDITDNYNDDMFDYRGEEQITLQQMANMLKPAACRGE